MSDVLFALQLPPGDTHPLTLILSRATCNPLVNQPFGVCSDPGADAQVWQCTDCKSRIKKKKRRMDPDGSQSPPQNTAAWVPDTNSEGTGNLRLFLTMGSS